jgi:hypothetical protein
MMRALLLAFLLMGPTFAGAQDTTVFTHADSIRGSVTPERAWWDAGFYDLHVRVSPSDSSISGWNGITYKVTGAAREMQIDLRLPLVADSVVQSGKRLAFHRDGDALLVTLTEPQASGDQKPLTLYYHAKAPAAKHAPCEGRNDGPHALAVKPL